jgi:O-methyltransferase involved in polyketide biosynthesis
MHQQQRGGLKLELDPQALASLAVSDEDADMPAAARGPFGEGGKLEWLGKIFDRGGEDTLKVLHAWDDKAVKDSSKNLQVLWTRAVLAKNGELPDDIAFKLLPRSTRDVVTKGLFDGASYFFEWVASRTAFLNEGCDLFLASPACAGGKDCQVVVFGAGFDTRSIRYQREGLRFFEVDLPDTIEAKRVVHERYKKEVDPDVRLPARVGFDLNDCEQRSLLDLLEREHGFRRDVPTMFISEAVMFYVKPKAIANLYGEIFQFGKTAEAMYSFTDSMRPFVQGPFSDEIMRFMDKQSVTTCSHTARWGGAVQFVHGVARTHAASAAEASADSLLGYVSSNLVAPINSYTPERTSRKPEEVPTFNNVWYALAYSSELKAGGEPYSTRLFGEPLTLKRSEDGASVTCTSAVDGTEYVLVDHQDVLFFWRGDPAEADVSRLPTHPAPDQTQSVETILDYGCDYKYIVENNLDTPHLYWLHDGSIPPLESLGCSRKKIDSISLRAFTDDVGVGHVGKTAQKTTKVVRFDAPNVVRHAGVSGFSEEFHIVPIGPQRTRVLLRQRIPKGPILSTLLKIPKSTELVQFLVRQWNYQIGLEDYSVMQGQAYNIDDLGAPNWSAASTGDDLIIRFWKHYEKALQNDGLSATGTEYFTRYDGTVLDEAACNAVRPERVTTPSHAAASQLASADGENAVAPQYMNHGPVADYPPINHQGFELPADRIQRIADGFKSPAGTGAGVGIAIGSHIAAALNNAGKAKGIIATTGLLASNGSLPTPPM